MTINIRELFHFTVYSDQIKDINILAKELHLDRPDVSLDEVMRAIRDPATFILVAERSVEGRTQFVGIATLTFYHRVLGGRAGIIEGVVVHKKFRRQGIGNELISELVRVAKQKAVTHLMLTSNDTHQTAHRLFRKHGFKELDTNVFRMDIQPVKPRR